MLMKPYWKYEILGFFLTILFTITVYLIPKASKILIDDVIPTNSTKVLSQGLILFTSICLAQPIVSYLKDRIFLLLTEKITYSIREKLFHNIIYSQFEFLDGAKGGNLISIITNDGRGASDFISRVYAILLKNALLVILIIIGMIVTSFEITLVVLLTFTVFYLISLLFGKRLRKLSMDVQMNYDELCTFIDQTNTSIITIKSNGQEANIENRYQSIISKMKNTNLEIGVLRNFISNITSASIIMCLAVIYGMGALNVMNGILTLGEVVELGLYFQLLEQPFFELLNLGINTNVIIPIFERIEKFEQLESEDIGEYEGKLDFECLHIDDIRFRYMEDQIEVLKGVSLSLPRHGLVSITGESGAGKTTFVKLLLGMYQPTAGEIKFDDMSIHDITLNTLRSNISYVPQNPEILNDTIRNNIIYGKDNISEDSIMRICKMLKLHDKIMSLPNQYDSVVTEKVNLSGGEKQRLAIARALLKKAPIMIFDEPLSALDPDNRSVVKDIINSISKDTLTLVISHYGYDDINSGIKIKFANGCAYKEELDIASGQ